MDFPGCRNSIRARHIVRAARRYCTNWLDRDTNMVEIVSIRERRRLSSMQGGVYRCAGA